MQFNKNKTVFIHQWYPFVEGYSKEFICNIIDEIDYTPEYVLDPFAGSGTTPVELQDLGINCYSFEVSPFMYLLSTVKLERSYKYNVLKKHLKKIENDLSIGYENIRDLVALPKAKTFQPNGKLKKWIFDPQVMDGILDIKYSISKIKDDKYKKLLKIALASILLDISNVYRNGKCLSYKKDWQNTVLTRIDIHTKFLAKVNNLILPDIKKLEDSKSTAQNIKYCFFGDVRKNISQLPDNTIDLIISSPPYLNSRDYTDIYIVELWMLDLIPDYPQMKELRTQTFRSHVQVKLGTIDELDIYELNQTLRLLESQTELWNSELPQMIKAYFIDMDILFEQLKKKMKKGKKIFFNVANSAYYGVEIKVDVIVSAIAETHGFVINEIREARQLKPSSQQKETISSLRESVIIMTS